MTSNWRALFRKPDRYFGFCWKTAPTATGWSSCCSQTTVTSSRNVVSHALDEVEEMKNVNRKQLSLRAADRRHSIVNKGQPRRRRLPDKLDAFCIYRRLKTPRNR